jgi:hypothetical protein
MYSDYPNYPIFRTGAQAVALVHIVSYRVGQGKDAVNIRTSDGRDVNYFGGEATAFVEWISQFETHPGEQK